MAINIVIRLFFYCHIVAMDFGALAAMMQTDRDIFEVCIFIIQINNRRNGIKRLVGYNRRFRGIEGCPLGCHVLGEPQD